MKLIIVESPTKAKTISRFLSSNYKVSSSNGHIRDLPSYQLGVDTENNFSPHYVVPRKSQKTVKELKNLAKKADELILATDEDREGEAIAWHLVQALGLNNKAQNANSVKRIVFHEITKQAIEEALKNPRQIDKNLVDAQQARRVLDRLVGYKLSPFLWKKLVKGLSAGRVQSVALRLIVEREKEIQNFKPEKYWLIEGVFQKKDCDEGETPRCLKFSGELIQVGEKKIERPGFKDKDEVQKILEELQKCVFFLEAVEKKAESHKPRPPFTTSSLQQESWRVYKFSAKKTMFLAQGLYEVGLITYMRTDSQQIAKEVMDSIRSFIEANFGKEYLESALRKFKKTSKLAQEAHEAIRPTDVSRVPESIKDDLTPEQYKLYDLIWRRTLATQMKDAIFDATVFWILAKKEKEDKKYYFRSSGQILRFPGFLKVYSFLKFQENSLPSLEAKCYLKADEISLSEHETKPPSRYNDGSLVKILEKYGIGRPSTYAPIIFTLQERGYIEKNQAKSFAPTEIGFKVSDLLIEHFSDIVDVGFTAKMENNLDEIAMGGKPWQPVISEFYGPFSENLKKKYEEVEKKVEFAGKNCPKCEKPLVMRHSRYGKFIGCSGFPDCNHIEKIAKEKPKPLDKPCPKCAEGKLIGRRNRRGKNFYGCTAYPKCDFTASNLEKLEQEK